MKPLATLSSIAVAVLLSACNATHEAAKEEAPPRPVLAAETHYAPRERVEVLPGVIKARIESDLAFRVGGKIAVRLVDAGAQVQAGQPLARLDETDFGLQLEQAEAEQLSARAARVQAEAEEKRITALSKQGWSATADFDKTRLAAEQARAAVIRADRTVALARNAIDYTTLRADADGVISAVEAEPGQVVAAGAPVVKLARSAELEAAVSVPETLIERARTAPARVAFWALPGLSAAARLRELAAASDPATRTYPARFTLIGAPKDVRLGMSLTVSLESAAAPVARLPIAAIFDRGRGPSVWVVGPDGALRATAVTLAGGDAESAFVSAGVADGARVVALGAHKFVEGDRVRVVESLAGL
jgi:RND family efflux transporter MFP subunit